MSQNSRVPVITLIDCLEILEDPLFTKKSRSQSLQNLQLILQDKDRSATLTKENLSRILRGIEKCLKLDIKCTPHALTAVSSLLANADLLSKMSTKALLPSASAVLNMLKSLTEIETHHLPTMGTQVLISYPEEVLSMIVRQKCSDVLEILENFAPEDYTQMQGGNKTSHAQQYKLFHNFLKDLLIKLPLEEKTQLMREDLPLWFKVIQVTMSVTASAAVGDIMIQYNVGCLEVLTEALIEVDYFEEPGWDTFLKCVCDSNMYPEIIQRQLERNTTHTNTVWHRIWIVIIKLLKTKVTRNGPYGTPITLMLRSVENAFKMNADNRYRAFECWDVLINNLSADIPNVKSVDRYIKLLITPLKLNNAKTAETARIKFHCWWKFIRNFQAKLDEWTDKVLFDFLHFMFGKKAYDERHKPYQIIVGSAQVYDIMKSLCIQAFIEIVGHSENCTCSSLPKLKEKMLNNRVLARYWEEWMLALKSAIIIAQSIYKNEMDKQGNKPLQILCMWRAFIVSIADLPPNGVRKDMYNELILVLVDLMQIADSEETLPDIIFALTLSLIDDNASARKLISSNGHDVSTQKLLTIFLNPKMDRFFTRNSTIKMVEILKPLTDYVLYTSVINTYLEQLKQGNSNSLKMWAALAHSIDSLQKFLDANTLANMLMWPVLAKEQVEEDMYLAKLWQPLYNMYAIKFNSGQFDKKIIKHLCNKSGSSCFRNVVAICVIKNRLEDSQDDIIWYTETLGSIAAKMIGEYKLYAEQVVPMLADTIGLMLNKVSSSLDEKLAKATLTCARHILMMCFSEIKSEDFTLIPEDMLLVIETIFKSLRPLIRISLYQYIFCEFLEVMWNYQIPLQKKSCLLTLLHSKLIYLRQDCQIDIVAVKIDQCIETLTEKSVEIIENSDKSKTFPLLSSPFAKRKEKAKKKAAVIVDTVTENGEEYAVVKSNWKFNPKKLTENQIEKLQRKREDIPALYQDLSQSQDEFRLSNWKTGSQDTTTSSNSKSNNVTTDNASNASIILKNIQSSNVVPNIMQNILENENDKNHNNATKVVSVLQPDKSNNVVRPSPTIVKTTKSPRVALKDRVFQNVRNLIEKSSPENNRSEANDAQVQLMKTPPAKSINNSNIINSAPPLISADRPSRTKKIPKKFEGVQLFGLKKRRFSQMDCQPPADHLNEDGEDKNPDLNNIAMPSIDSTSEVNSQPNSEHVSVIEEVEATVIEDAHELTEETSQNESTKEKNENTSDIQKNNDDLSRSNEEVHKKTDSEKNVDSGDLQNNDREIMNSNKSYVYSRKDDSSQHIQENSDDPDVQMDVVAHDSQKNDSEDKAQGNIALNNESEDLNKEPVISKTPVQETKEASQKTTTKKSATKKSRIEKELAIDMVEGHPFLKVHSEKRLTRKKLTEFENTGRRRSVPEKPNKTKSQPKVSPKGVKKSKEKDMLSGPQDSVSVTVEETQEKKTLSEDAPYSEDVIESSQDSTLTTITVKSTKRTPKRQPVVSIKRLKLTDPNVTATQDLLQDSECEMLCVDKSIDQETKDDSELPQNKTAEVDSNHVELTENMDTEPIIDKTTNDEDVIIIDDDRDSPIIVNSEANDGLQTQELAEADTLPNNPTDFCEYEHNEASLAYPEAQSTHLDITESMCSGKLTSTAASESQVEISSETCREEIIETCSALEDDAQRKKDCFSSEILSPIKVQSPDKEKSSSENSEETSNDDLIVKLSYPVYSDGEPISSKGSPEFFPEDKTSPDKRDLSPPRVEVIAKTNSPSSLSLKRNRRHLGGRGAHMVGLCVPESVTAKNDTKKSDCDEPKKPNTSTPARRNLRVLYAGGDNNDVSEDNEEENFLKLKKPLPSVDSSPAVPILKRKIDVLDDTSASPASKRKRVSFHDPPVSTTVSVQKYIKTDCIESPSSTHKRQNNLEPPIMRISAKSLKRLDNTLKLDTVLSKAIESFIEPDSLPNDTNMSLDITPAVEVVVTSELNDMDPICPDLIHCKDSIENIAEELSSPAMKDLLIKELDGKILTVGDLAKMTELEVNRLCIKAPKVKVVKKVLEAYISERVSDKEDQLDEIIIPDETEIAMDMNEVMVESESLNIAVETQTDLLTCETASQTATVEMVSTQTAAIPTKDCFMQTLESGYKTTNDVITSCLSEREDFIKELCKLLPTDTVVEMLAEKSDKSTSTHLLTKLLDRESKNLPNEERNTKELSILKDFLLERFEQRDLMLFCSRLFQGLYDKCS